MGIWTRIKRIRLEFKILFILTIGLVLGFGSYVIYSVQSESKALLQQHREKSHLFAETLNTGIRHVMLAGRSGYLRSIIEESRENFNGIGRFQVFNNHSKEIIPETGPFIAQLTEDKDIIKLVESGNQTNIQSEKYIEFLKNENDCQSCHGSDHTLRAVIPMKLEYTKENQNLLAGEITSHAFEAIMLSGKGEDSDLLMKELQKVPGVRRALVYDPDGYIVVFGDDEDELPEPIAEEAAEKFHENLETKFYPSYIEEGVDTYLFPLKNKEACVVCHGGDHDIRGILALSYDSDINQSSHFPEKTITSGFETMMLLERGLHAGKYIQNLRQLSNIKSLQVFDNGLRMGSVRELYVPNPKYQNPALDDSVYNLIQIANLNPENKNRLEYREKKEDNITYLTQVIPLMNDEKCQGCHNPPKPDDPDFAIEKDIWKVRSSIKVSTSMEPVLDEIERNLYASVGVGILTVLMVGITLRIFMKLVVVKPLLIIGAAADKIGKGDLTVTASVKSEDEIGSLADRINTMIQGLRERLHLTKFVSEETVGAVEGKDMEGVSLGGERKDATVLFSDIRNFTSYSEKVEPEEVIDMLNSYLNSQAEVVKNNGGDIDKFVGDELMAVFKGKSMVEKAVKCSVEIQKKIAVMNKKNKKNIEVGIGINAGPMVMGAMGSKDRMDYTVLGDNVNLGARLCSAAKPGEIIISNRAVRFLPKSHSVDLRPLDPLKVKGKKDVIEVFSITLDQFKN